MIISIEMLLCCLLIDQASSPHLQDNMAPLTDHDCLQAWILWNKNVAKVVNSLGII